MQPADRRGLLFLDLVQFVGIALLGVSSLLLEFTSLCTQLTPDFLFHSAVVECDRYWRSRLSVGLSQTGDM